MVVKEEATVFIYDFANAVECVWEVGDDVSRGGERWCCVKVNRGRGIGLVGGSVYCTH